MAEDDYLDTLDIRRTLDKMGLQYHLEVAANGEEAISLLESRGGKLPDVVLIDINMPKMNGLELLSTLRRREDWKGLKCFMITTSDEKVDRDQARQLGVSLDWRTHARIGVPVTVATLAVAAAWLVLIG